MGQLIHEPEADQNDARHEEEHSQQADAHALGQGSAQVGADAEAHEEEGDEADDSGQTAGQDGGGGFAQRLLHGRLGVGVFQTALAEPVDEEDRVVQGHGKLQDVAGGVGDEGDLAEDEVGAGVDHHRHADAQQDHQRFQPRGSHQGEHHQDDEDGHDSDLLNLADRAAGGDSRADGGAGHGVVVTDELPDGGDGGVDVGFPDGHRVQGDVVLIIRCHRVLVQQLQGQVQCVLVVQPARSPTPLRRWLPALPCSPEPGRRSRP